MVRSLRKVLNDGFDGPEHLIFVQNVLNRIAAADQSYTDIVAKTSQWIEELCDTFYDEGEYPFGLKEAPTTSGHAT